MRWLVLMALAACDFTHGVTVPDGPPPDRPPDMSQMLTWSVDNTSGKAVPSTLTEWMNFITSRQLGISPPDSLWLMQESAGTLQDTIGSVALATAGSEPAQYQQLISGWSRRAIKSTDGSGVLFFNNSDPSLPNLATSSMTVLLLYANTGTPAATRSILVAGCCSGYATFTIDAAKHYGLSVNVTGNAIGAMDHGTDVIPIVLKLDHTNGRQAIITNTETIAPANTQLAPYRGLYIGAANGAAPDGRWLYMAAWYGTKAEMSDAKVAALITALGW